LRDDPKHSPRSRESRAPLAAPHPCSTNVESHSRPAAAATPSAPATTRQDPPRDAARPPHRAVALRESAALLPLPSRSPRPKSCRTASSPSRRPPQKVSAPDTKSFLSRESRLCSPSIRSSSSRATKPQSVHSLRRSSRRNRAKYIYPPGTDTRKRSPPSRRISLPAPLDLASRYRRERA